MQTTRKCSKAHYGGPGKPGRDICPQMSCLQVSPPLHTRSQPRTQPPEHLRNLGPCLAGEWEKEAGLCLLTSHAALWPARVGEAWRQGGWPGGGQGPEGQAGPDLRSPLGWWAWCPIWT